MEREIVIKIMKMQKKISDRYNEGVSPDEDDLLSYLTEQLDELVTMLYEMNHKQGAKE